MSDFEDFIDTVIKKGNIDEARRRWQPQYKDQKDNGGWTALHWACFNSEGGGEDLVSLLISLGCDVEAQENAGWRPLHVCAINGNLESMRALLDAGCSLSPLDKTGETPLMVADKKGHPECASLLRSSIEAARRPSMTNYVEGDLLGRGVFGVVYKCHDPNNDMYFTIKKVPVSVSIAGAVDEEIKALENEIKIYSELKYHKRILQYFGTTIDKGQMIVFLEYSANGSLRDMIIKSGLFSIMMVTKYSRQILEGLEFLHGHKIIHRDIKAANIMRDAEDDIKLSNFEMSKSLLTTSNGNDGFNGVGTPHWMAPEVIKDTIYDYRADVWSLGATILEMLTGKPPYHELETFQVMYKIANGSPVDRYFPSNLDQKTKSFLEKMFVHDPSERADVKTLLESSFFQDS